MKVPLLDRGFNPAPRWALSDWFVAVALVVAGLALRIPGLNQGMWIDEIWTLAWFIRLPVAEIIDSIGATNNHVFYTLCAHFASSVLGESVWAIRLPAVLFGVASLPALYYLGRQVAARDEAFLAALFMTLNYQHVWYSQNARGYSALLLGAVVGSIFFIRLIASVKPSAWLIVAYALVATLSAWTHLTAAFVLLAHGLIWLVLASKPNRPARRAVVMPTFIALLLAGLLTMSLYAPMFESRYSDIASVSTTDPASLVENANGESHVLSGQNRWVVQEFVQGMQKSLPGGWLAVAVIVFVLLTGIVSYFRQSVLIVALLLLPALLTYAVIYSYTKFFFPRYVFGSMGFLIMMAVRGGFVSAGACLPFLSRRNVLISGCLIALAGTALVPAAWQPKQDFVAAAEFVEHQLLPGDAIVCARVVRLPLQELLELDCSSPLLLPELLEIEAQHQRTWFIYSLPYRFEGLQRKIFNHVLDPSEYVKVKEFAGTLNSGNLIVLLKSPDLPRPPAAPDVDR